jgi:hypothetical protein
MCLTTKTKASGARQLDKLVHLPTPFLGVVADCTKLPADPLDKRARSKYYNQHIIGPMLGLDSPLHKGYLRAYYCNSKLIQKGKKIIGEYCNSRICNICNRIRTAKFINGYMAPLEALGQTEFVTLTIPNVPGEALRSTIKLMLRNLSNIVRVLRERRNIQLNGLRKIEVTYNKTKNTFHPHIHMIVDSAAGEIIIKEWLHRYPKAKRKGQDCKTANQGSYLELFKYATKIIEYQKNKDHLQIIPYAIDVIMCALHQVRTFQTFGKIERVSEEVEELQAAEYDIIEEDFTEWIYDERQNDWVDLVTGDLLTNYQPPPMQITVIY